ncbi:unnamed protein product [Allacma fusca]|uniref:EGF-like domain-containing protein n=1 Tax=Allacma fusca TaxID=39272 RepID=A0A8J2PLP6_9HEXA|nr:unnamed protein product [Allacma fusca]
MPKDMVWWMCKNFANEVADFVVLILPVTTNYLYLFVKLKSLGSEDLKLYCLISGDLVVEGKMMIYILLAFVALQLTPTTLAQYRDVLDPCSPSPCGPNTHCSVNAGGAAVCRCLPGNFPKPDTITGCGPQCTSDYECRSHERCYGSKCVSACDPSPCGVNADCESYNHKSICKCLRGYTGDPFVQCAQQSPIARRIISVPNTQALASYSNPCSPSPCGTNANCHVSGDRPVCTCAPGHQGNPLTYCSRGECSSNSECPSFKVCENFNCVNPCSTACGPNAACDVRNHIPVCSCPPGYTGDPVRHCRVYDENELCNPSPCGVNTKCRVENGRAICSCAPSFFGNPLTGCRHECERDSECGPSESCIQFKCKNPCSPSPCGQYATCDVRGHVAVCKCPQDYLGDPNVRCFPECTSHAECPGNLACIGLKCADPCKGACGVNADCRVDRSNHKAICSCPKGFTGHPFQECRRFTPADLCQPNPCGANAVCNPGHDNSGRERPVCTCPSGYIGDALKYCSRGECVTDSDCGPSRSCSNYNCINPCANACGVNANCEVRNHGAVCSCPRGFRGDPFTQCTSDPARGKRQSVASNSTLTAEPKKD